MKDNNIIINKSEKKSGGQVVLETCFVTVFWVFWVSLSSVSAHNILCHAGTYALSRILCLTIVCVLIGSALAMWWRSHKQLVIKGRGRNTSFMPVAKTEILARFGLSADNLARLQDSRCFHVDFDVHLGDGAVA